MKIHPRGIIIQKLKKSKWPLPQAARKEAHRLVRAWAAVEREAGEVKRRVGSAHMGKREEREG
jgi:hypothetical protein